MRIYNRSRLLEAEVRELLAFAMQGIKDNQVLIEVTDTESRGWSGVAWDIGTNKPAYYSSSLPEKYIQRYWTKGKNSQYRYFILIRVPPEIDDHSSSWTFTHKWSKKKYPDGVSMDTWQDHFVTIAAHEGRHLWQYLRNRRLKAKGKKRKQPTEVDAEKHSVKIYNKWREKTGRPIIEAVKQSNPFVRDQQVA